MTLVILFGILVLIWMTNYIFGRLFPPKAQRGILFFFFAVLGVVMAILLFKVLKTFFVVAVPVAILLTFMVLTRKK
ncbi:hypothetical protein [Flavobacterium sp.]|uniref:hypothetical protein n=1 Tax=Flavobacterium sp. TaxID=239 RepID=UPI0012050115|nr:hypothetical protein [Flavobacterium sp.]RZJ71255.1 MAG: hypothetical protein EOO49_10930 [Flavobacterium sp.]